MKKNDLKKYLVAKYKYFECRLANVDDLYMRHYYQGRLDFISEIFVRFNIESHLFDDL